MGPTLAGSTSGQTPGLFNIFEPGLKRGAERLAFNPKKKYFYVEHPTEGWRVYIRSVGMLHEEGVPFDPFRFLVVKRKGATAGSKAWEPTKGQMEGKDAKPMEANLIELMAENVRREVEEEAKIKEIHGLKYTGLVVQSREQDYPKHHYFQYHIFQATVSSDLIEKAQKRFEWLNNHPKYFDNMDPVKREKDALRWFSPKETKLMGKWSPSIVALYLENAGKDVKTI
jgi:8-oxo-dGTP pyrophosphatase MutT (NUDIX family)